MSTQPLRIAALISGGGRTLINLHDLIMSGSLPATIELVIASRREIEGVRRALGRGLDVRLAPRGDFASETLMHDQITRWLTESRIDLVCLCGYLRWFRIDQAFRGRVINIHPALLPRFGGHGMHGDHVHQAVLDARCTQSGCTVHFVDAEYDHGPIILQRRCPVLPDDNVHSLAARVFEEERLAYAEAIRAIAEGRVTLENDSRVAVRVTDS